MRKLKIIGLSLFICFVGQLNLSACPDGYEYKQASWVQVGNQQKLHCDMAGHDSCCKKIATEEEKGLG